MPQRLPFVKGADFWSVEPTGNWSEDTRTGRSYADEFIAFAQKEDAANVLGSVVRSMIGHGAYGGIEAGFMSGVAARAIGSVAVAAASLVAVPVLLFAPAPDNSDLTPDLIADVSDSIGPVANCLAV